MPKDPEKQALIYARASADKSDQKISVDRQIKLCTARAADLWPDVEIRSFRDDGVTAANPDVQRLGFDSFVSALRSAPKGSIVGVVVNEQSRLTRQPAQWNELVVTLSKAGVTKVETLRAGPISVEAGNRLVGGILALVDAEEVERTKARVKAAHVELFEQGRPSGRAPFGYRSTKDCPGMPLFPGDDKGNSDSGRRHLEIDPTEAEAVRLAFDMVLKGHAISAIVDTLNAGNVKPRSASFKFKDGRTIAKWTPVSVRCLLKVPTVAGLRGHTDEDGRLHTTRGRWEALIDVEQWKAVQQILEQPTEVTGSDGQKFWVRTKPAPRPRKYLLSGGRRRGLVSGVPGESYGVLRCGKCGHPMIAQMQNRSSGKRVPAYSCHPRVDPGSCSGVSISPADELERLVVDAIKAELAATPELRQRLDVTDDADVARWRTERDSAKARMLEAGKMLGANEIDRDTFDAMHGPAKAAHEHAKTRLESMATDTTMPSADDVLNRWDGLTLKQQRAVVEHLIDSIEIAPVGHGIGSFNAARVGVPRWKV
jgi:DNA invertase Pin-like site-specific DNA recombinase